MQQRLQTDATCNMANNVASVYTELKVYVGTKWDQKYYKSNHIINIP